MAPDQITQAVCHKCQSAMSFVTAMPHPTARQMRRTTFVCYTCGQTRNYMLSALMADAYAAASRRDVKVIPEKRQ
jgi:RNase P subunit RPR2